MNLSIARLQQLIAVAKCGSFSKAAAELNITQPALSRSIAAMEARYGFAIFNRVGHGVELTAAGTQVAAQAEQLLQNMRVFDSNLKLIGAGAAGKLAMGLAPLLASQLLGRFTSEFFSRRSKAELRVVIRRGDELLAALKNDEIELFFFPESYIDAGSDVAAEYIGEMESIVVVRSGHPLASRRSVTVEEVTAFPWASSVDPAILPEAANPPRLLCDNYHIMREALPKTDLVCVCSAEFVAAQLADGTLREIKVQGRPIGKIKIFAASLRGRMRSPLATDAIKRMRKYL